MFKIALKSCAFFTYSLVVTVAFNAACYKAVAQSVVFQSRYVETLHKSMIIVAIGAWLCHNAESQQPFDEIKHRNTHNEVGDVSEGTYDWKIVKEQGIGGFSIWNYMVVHSLLHAIYLFERWAKPNSPIFELLNNWK